MSALKPIAVVADTPAATKAHAAVASVTAPERPRRPRSSWAYPPTTGRDLRIDLLRGLAVLVMIVDHLGGPSPLTLLTGGNRFFTSAAEGFVFLSGLTVGIVYHDIATRQGLGAAIRRLLQRAGTLYVLAVALTLLLLPMSESLRLPWAAGVAAHTPAELLWSIFSLRQTYYLSDVMLLYVLLLLASPIALALLWEGRTALLLGASCLLWLATQLFPSASDLPWPIAGNLLFHWPAWQLIFFTALALGFHRQRVARLTRRLRRGPLLAISLLACAALVTLFNGLAALPGDDALRLRVDDLLFAKFAVRPGRLLASAVVFGTLFQLTTLFWSPLRKATGWLLLPFGQNALYAYAAHVILALAVALAGIALASTPEWLSDNPVSSALLQLAGLLLVWIGIRWRVLAPAPAHRRLWTGSLAPLAGLAVLTWSPSPVPLASVAPVAAADPMAAAAVARARAFGTPIPRGADLDANPVARPPAAMPAPSAADVALAPPPASALVAPSPLITGRVPQLSFPVGPLRGTFVEVTFFSTALGVEMPYLAYFPPGYGASDARYPVLYMLHGGSGDKEEWGSYGIVGELDRQITTAQLHPLILVMPQGDLSYWVNQPDDGPRWGDYISQDLVRHVDATYRTQPDAAHRAIGGLSMGGAGALQLAFNNPDIFQVVGAHSPALHVDDGSFTLYGRGADFAQREPLVLARRETDLSSFRIWMDAGADDPWLDRDLTLRSLLVSRGARLTWDILPGGHESPYWMDHLPLYLRFYDAALAEHDADP